MKNRKQRTGYGQAGSAQTPGEQGYMLLGLIVAIALILLALSVAATKVAFSLRREREVESARRADQYVRAIRKFYLKNNHYPGSIEQLENTNRVRYLRQRYIDPLTGKADYRVIPVGQNKTTVKGFFGEPLAGIASTGLGSAAGMQSSGIGGPGVGGIGGAAGAGAAGSSGTGGTAGAAGTSGAAGSSGAGSSGTGGTDTSGAAAPGAAGGLGSAAGFSNLSGVGAPGTTGPFMGVGSSATGDSILVVNEQTTFQTWEFLYDPRLEKLRAAGALNAGAGSIGAGALGQTPGSVGQTPGPFGPTPTIGGTGAAGGSTGGATGAATPPQQ